MNAAALRTSLSLICALCVAWCAATAHASTAGFSLERYTPTNPGEWAFWIDKPWYTSGPNFLAAGLSFDYSHDPLVLGTVQGSQVIHSEAVIAHQLVGHVEVAASFLDRITAAVNLPVVLVERGTPGAGVTPISHPSLSDPRIGAMVRILGQSLQDVVSLHGGAQLWIPLGSQSHISDGLPRLLLKAVAAGRLTDWLLYSGTAGFLLRRTATVGNLPEGFGNTVGSEMRLGASLSYADIDRGFMVGPEANYSTVVTSQHVFNTYYSSLEVLLGAHYNPTGYLHTGVAVGVGLLREPGTPDFRGLFRIAYTPNLTAAEPQRDRDGDGILDKFDRCPDTVGLLVAREEDNGCPDGDGDGVSDPRDLCPQESMGPHPDPNQVGCPSRDADGDGILDSNDLCPQQPAGDHPRPDRPGCPDVDSDGDGLYDAADLCPSAPSGPSPDPEHVGCPLADRDHDSVPDNVDACPDTAGMPSSNPKKNGCPGLLKIQGQQIFTSEPVFFANGQDVILSRSFAVLKALAQILTDRPDIRRLSIEGHTDNRGQSTKNQDLSERRARSVMFFLKAQGVSADRLEAHGWGDSRPVAGNQSSAGRALNRRVEFHIVPVVDAPALVAPPAAR